jgi:hypothetical protein
MKALRVWTVAGPLILATSSWSFAQDYGPSQLRLWAQIYRSQHPFIGLYTGRIDGRPTRSAGFPPSAANTYSGAYAYSFDPNDCAEIDSFAPDARPGWQARVRSACR